MSHPSTPRMPGWHPGKKFKDIIHKEKGDKIDKEKSAEKSAKKEKKRKDKIHGLRKSDHDQAKEKHKRDDDDKDTHSHPEGSSGSDKEREEIEAIGDMMKAFTSGKFGSLAGDILVDSVTALDVTESPQPPRPNTPEKELMATRKNSAPKDRLALSAPIASSPTLRASDSSVIATPEEERKRKSLKEALHDLREKSPVLTAIKSKIDEKKEKKSKHQSHNIGGKESGDAVGSDSEDRATHNSDNKKDTSKGGVGAVSPRGPHFQVANVRVHVKAARNLKAFLGGPFEINDPYVKVCVEGHERETRVQPKTVDPEWDEIFEFPVTDITTDIRLHVIDHHKIGKDAPIGQVVLPLARYLSIAGPSSAGSEWFEIYPLTFDKDKFSTAIDGVPTSGLEKPPKTLGFLSVEVSVNLGEQLHLSYLLSAPIKKETTKLSKVDPYTLKRNGARLKRALTDSPFWLTFVKSILSWENPTYSLLAIAFLCYLCLVAEPWQYPLLFAFVFVLLSYMSWGKAKHDYIIIWNNHINRDKMLPKIKLLHSILLDLQYGMGEIASRIEKTKNLWNWTDPRITLLANFALLVVAAVLSSTIYLMGFLLQWMPLSVFVLTFGLLVLLPPSVKGWHIKAIPTSAAPQVALATQPAPTAVNKVLQCIDNILARVPDNDEVVHRVIADGQLCNEMSTRV